MRDMIWDKPKSVSQLLKEQGKTCIIPGCNNPLTQMKGPGESTLCRDCQLKSIEYGGMGRKDRPSTFHRTFVCDDCGYNPLEDQRLSDIDDFEVKHRVARMLMHGDHSEKRKADGGSDAADNIRCLCYVCHAKKTAINNDWKKPKNIELQ